MKFKIDFFEFCILAEACITPAPIVRHTFFKSLSEKYYAQLTKDQRKQLFEYIIRHGKFSRTDKDCQHFYDRFNPNNQHRLFCNHEGERYKVDAYYHKEEYHTKEEVSILRECIKEIKKI